MVRDLQKINNMNKVIEVIGEYTWRIPCKNNEQAGFEITINSGQPNIQGKEEEIYDTDGYSGLEGGFVKFRGYNKETGWESEWECSLESVLRLFARRCEDGKCTKNGEKVNFR